MPQVPITPPPPQIAATPIEPAIVRLARDRTVLDPIWGLAGSALALVWPDDRASGGWARAIWPLEPMSRQPVAPIDLHVGHVLEVGGWRGSDWQYVYAWIADADGQRFVVVPSASAVEAVGMAGRAFDVWRAAELSRLEDEWRERFARATRSGNPTS